MKLAEIRLRNWKAYRSAALTLPIDDPQANVIVIRGANGAGKTSLMEAVAFALFGRHALALAARARGGDRPEISYDAFLERAVNVASKGQDARMSVELTFVQGGGNLVSLERVWHFTAGGRHRRDDEELHLRQGEDLDPVPVPVEADRQAALQAMVAEEVLPANIAPFFIFDGEQVSLLASRSAEEQLRGAAEVVVGAPELRGIAGDLRAFARDRRRDLQAHGDHSAVGIETELEQIGAQEQASRKEVEKLAGRIAPLRVKRDELVRRIGALHGDSYANFKSLFEERELHARSRSAKQEELRKALSVDLALALAGSPLRNAARAQLEAEDSLDRWERTAANLDERFNSFIGHLSDAWSEPVPEDVRQSLHDAWAQAWAERPHDMVRLHTYLGEADRSVVLSQLVAVSVTAGNAVATIAKDLEATDARIAAIEREISNQRGLDEQAQSLASELGDVQQELAELESLHREQVQALDSIRLRAVPLRQELGRRLSLEARSAPARKRAADAEAYAQALEDLVDDALPACVEQLATAASQAYRQMAHKKLVQVVQVDERGLRMVGEGGKDVSGLDASAGETQIFALALMASVAGSYPYFPIIMDTPFARLDPEHRDNVLRHFAGLGVQLILLAHPGELDQRSLLSLGASFAGTVDVSHQLDEDLGYSRFTKERAVAHGA